jgi:hypothetical protein
VHDQLTAHHAQPVITLLETRMDLADLVGLRLAKNEAVRGGHPVDVTERPNDVQGRLAGLTRHRAEVAHEPRRDAALLEVDIGQPVGEPVQRPSLRVRQHGRARLGPREG